MTALGGTVYWIISFHFSLVSVSPVEAAIVEYAAYQIDADVAINIKPTPNQSHFFNPEAKVPSMVSFVSSRMIIPDSWYLYFSHCATVFKVFEIDKFTPYPIFKFGIQRSMMKGVNNHAYE